MRGPEGGRLVVKWDADPISKDARRVGVELTARLRDEAAWPVPQQWIVESDTHLFVLQEFLPGHPVGLFSTALLTRLLELHECRLGLARPDRRIQLARWADPDPGPGGK